MTSGLVHPPLRIGVIGLGHYGLHFLERWIDDRDIRIIAACDEDSGRRDVAANLCERVTGDAESILSDQQIEVVFLDVPTSLRAALATRAINSGKHVAILDPPIAETTREVRELFESAAQGRRKVIVGSPWQDDEDFRVALAVARSRSTGSLCTLRFERWTASSFEIKAAVRDEAALSRRAIAGLFGQAVALADRSPIRVVAMPSNAGVSAFVEFECGLQASLSLKTSTAINLDTGWAIDGEHGGYAAGRRWIRTFDGETYDVPAEPLPFVDFKCHLLETIRDDGPPCALTKSLRLVALLAGFEESLRTRQAAAIEAAA